ncbi:MAG: IscS subfamily cysteine desulfurase, partial [Gloeomargarita sp. SZTDM-1c_bins_89]
SACSTGRPSHVLLALGLSPTLAASSVRFGLGRWTTQADIEQVVAYLRELLPALRRNQYTRV